MALQRFSSRRHRLYDAFLGDRLKGAVAYDRIAGYFQSSLLGLAAQEFKAIKQVHIAQARFSLHFSKRPGRGIRVFFTLILKCL